MTKYAILLSCCAFGAGLLFLGLGISAFFRKKPMGFMTGVKFKPEEITDLRAFNRANGRMWMIFSAPWWLAGVSGLLTALSDRFMYLYLILLIIAGSVGMYWLLNTYDKITRKYVDK